MPRKTKRFIDKKNATTYHVIHRSQKDPLQADEDASQRVLITDDELAIAKRKEKLTTFGIYYDDEYDYEQHLRDVDDTNKVEFAESFRVGDTAKSKISLPAEVLPSLMEEKIGMLELAAPVSGPRLDWDPDIVAALDSDNEDVMDGDLEDDFMLMANQSGDDEEMEADVSGDRQRQWIEEQLMGGHLGPSVTQNAQCGQTSSQAENDSDIPSDFEDDDELGSLQSFSDDDAKTRFTNYSMSSSVMKRNEHLTLLDDKFEKLYAEYDGVEIGALDHEDIDGKVNVTGPMMSYILEQFEKQNIKQGITEPMDQKDTIEVCSDVESSEDDQELTKVTIDEGCANKWDCESILSTYSNLYNHPRVIEEPWVKKKSKKIELTKKLGIPVESLQQKGLTKKQLQALDKMADDYGQNKTASPARKKDETPEERHERKAAVKEERKERRVEKKNTKLAFRHEEAIQKRQNIKTANNLAGHKIL